MNDLVIVFCVGAVCVLSAYCVRTYNVQVLRSALKKESESLRLEMMKSRKLLTEFSNEPQEMLTEGLAGAGLGPMLESLDLNSIKELIPLKYHVFLPVVQGFLDQIKKKGVSESVSQKESQFISQV